MQPEVLELDDELALHVHLAVAGKSAIMATADQAPALLFLVQPYKNMMASGIMFAAEGNLYQAASTLISGALARLNKV